MQSVKEKIVRDLFDWAEAHNPIETKSGQSKFLANQIEQKLGSVTPEPPVSGKTLIRMYDVYINKKGKMRVSVNIWDSICRFLNYSNFADYVGQNIEGDNKMNTLNLKPADFDKEDQRNEWPVYQVAFLWFDLEPPNTEQHFHLMTRDIEDKKYELHHAIDDGRLKASRTYQFANGITRYITREALVAYAETIKQQPKFLFKERR